MPLVPFFFILVAEVLAKMIRGNNNIKGLTLEGSILKLNQFADDITCFLANRDSLPELLSTLNKFHIWSGLCINKDKSKILQPGSQDEQQIKSIPVVSQIKVLRIRFDTDDSDENAYHKNFKSILDKIKSMCGTWSNRSLTLKGKVTVINSLMASLLQYRTSAVYTLPPPSHHRLQENCG